MTLNSMSHPCAELAQSQTLEIYIANIIVKHNWNSSKGWIFFCVFVTFQYGVLRQVFDCIDSWSLPSSLF